MLFLWDCFTNRSLAIKSTIHIAKLLSASGLPPLPLVDAISLEQENDLLRNPTLNHSYLVVDGVTDLGHSSLSQCRSSFLLADFITSAQPKLLLTFAKADTIHCFGNEFR